MPVYCLIHGMSRHNTIYFIVLIRVSSSLLLPINCTSRNSCVFLYHCGHIPEKYTVLNMHKGCGKHYRASRLDNHLSITAIVSRSRFKRSSMNRLTFIKTRAQMQMAFRIAPTFTGSHASLYFPATQKINVAIARDNANADELRDDS